MKNIAEVGSIGAGTMGKRIAFSCVISGKETELYDILPEAADHALQTVRALIKERIAAGNLGREVSEPALSLLSLRPTLEACVSGIDLAIETVTENVELKRKGVYRN